MRGLARPDHRPLGISVTPRPPDVVCDKSHMGLLLVLRLLFSLPYALPANPLESSRLVGTRWTDADSPSWDYCTFTRHSLPFPLENAGVQQVGTRRARHFTHFRRIPMQCPAQGRQNKRTESSGEGTYNS